MALDDDNQHAACVRGVELKMRRRGMVVQDAALLQALGKLADAERGAAEPQWQVVELKIHIGREAYATVVEMRHGAKLVTVGKRENVSGGMSRCT